MTSHEICFSKLCQINVYYDTYTKLFIYWYGHGAKGIELIIFWGHLSSENVFVCVCS